MITLLQNIETCAPEPLGRRDILLAADRIAGILTTPFPAFPGVNVIDGSGLVAVPGFIDGHVHILGGGGEGGYGTRTPELTLSEALAAGVTTLVGCLGTDGITRGLAALLAKARGLEDEGLTAYIYTGSYGVPPVSLTGSPESDLVLIDKVIGVGEIALSDHRSSQPTFDAVAALAGDARRGGMLSGKAGLVNVHLGDGPRGLELLRRILAETELPATQFLPTHVNRSPRVLEDGAAYAKAGGWVDLTTTAPTVSSQVPAAEAYRYLCREGVPPERITFTSDGQGSLPEFDAAGQLQGLEVGRMRSLFETFLQLCRDGVPLEQALRPLTTSPARILGLRRKGSLAEGMDADLLLLDRTSLELHTVIARGRVLVSSGALRAKGTFEPTSILGSRIP